MLMGLGGIEKLNANEESMSELEWGLGDSGNRIAISNEIKMGRLTKEKKELDHVRQRRRGNNNITQEFMKE